MKRKLVDLSVSNRENFKKQRKMIKGVQKRVDRVVLYNTRSINVSSDSPAVMYDCQSLHEYYIEHEFGIGGNKATKPFTKAEKRKNKDKICLRKKLVDAVKYLLPHTPATEACMRLEAVYCFDGRKSFTVYRTDKSCFQLINHVAYCFFRVSHHFTFYYWFII